MKCIAPIFVIRRSQGIMFVVLDCSLDAADGTDIGGRPARDGAMAAAAIEFRGAQQLQRASEAHLLALRGRLALLRSRGVTLVLSTRPAATPLLAFLCLEAGIALVAGLEEDEARGLAEAAGITMSASAGVRALQEASIGRADRCYRLSLGRTSTALVLELAPQQVCVWSSQIHTQTFHRIPSHQH